MEQKKPWYQSKIVLLGITLALVNGTQLAFNWLGTQVTPEQIQVIQQASPEVAQQLETAFDSQNWFQALSAVGGFLTAIWRTWFTNTKLV